MPNPGMPSFPDRKVAMPAARCVSSFLASIMRGNFHAFGRISDAEGVSNGFIFRVVYGKCSDDEGVMWVLLGVVLLGYGVWFKNELA